MTSARILEVFGVVEPRPDQTAMADYLCDCENAIQALNDTPDAAMEARKRLGLAVLQQIENAHSWHPERDLDCTPGAILQEAKWRVGDNV